MAPDPAGWAPEDDRPGLLRPGHLAGDFLNAPQWEVQEQSDGLLRLGIELPDHVRNPRGQLFGGFAGTYIDIVALSTLHASEPGPATWYATTSMHIDYLAPVTGPHFVAEGRVVASPGRNRAVDVTLTADDGTPAVLARVLLRAVPPAPTP